MQLRLSDIKSKFPDAKNTGKDIITDMMPTYATVYHIDSHDTEKGYRFQGVVINANPNLNDPHVFDVMPLEVLKRCSHYNIIVNNGFLVWTLWFER
jgi:hypothetical protein